MEIDITNEVKRFRKFLDEENNENIIFSGIFGIGKSYFINNFFNYSQNSNDYIQIYITPVNYSVASNEDIFEYIKVDILMQLLLKTNYDFNQQKIDFSVGAYYFLKNNAYKLFSSIATIAEKVQSGTDVIPRLIKLKSNIKDFIEKNSVDEEKDAIEFVNHMGNQIGSIYENNAITQIIQSIVGSVKCDKDSKNIVLVIDDLDRIDPEHIFRILNVLSAHNNFCGTINNKFGFDKTILVCDIENIKHIYNAKYGIKVDFNGYIDKFYSKEVYMFDNTENIISKLSHMLVTVNCPRETESYINPINSSTPISNTCHSILSILIKSRSLNLRTLLNNMIEKNFNHTARLNYYTNNSYNCIGSIIILKFIQSLFSSSSTFEDAMQNIENHDLLDFSDVVLNDLTSTFISLADYENCKFQIGDYFYHNIKYSIVQDFKPFGLSRLDFNQSEYKAISYVNLINEAYRNYKRNFINI